jgi:DNA-binding NtrC family response regulator
LRTFEPGFICGGAAMQAQLNVLVASSNLENRRSLIQILEALPLNVFSSSTLQQAEEALSSRSMALVFCDDHLVDGPYPKLLSKMRENGETGRFIVTTTEGEWEDYLDATRLGAFDMIRWPLHPTDVELIVIRAMHQDQQSMSYHMTA